MASFKPYSTASKLLGAGATLQNNVPEIQGKLADVVSEAIRVKAEEIAAAARERAPIGDSSVDPHAGQLRDSITVEQYNEPGAVGWRVSAGATGTPGKGGFEYPYARLVEFGSMHNSPQPFLYPAFDERVADTVSAIQKALEDL